MCWKWNLSEGRNIMNHFQTRCVVALLIVSLFPKSCMKHVLWISGISPPDIIDKQYLHLGLCGHFLRCIQIHSMSLAASIDLERGYLSCLYFHLLIICLYLSIPQLGRHKPCFTSCDSARYLAPIDIVTVIDKVWCYVFKRGIEEMKN